MAAADVVAGGSKVAVAALITWAGEALAAPGIIIVVARRLAWDAVQARLLSHTSLGGGAVVARSLRTMRCPLLL